MSVVEIDPDDTLEVVLERQVRDIWLDTKELEGYRRHNGARPVLMQPQLLDDLEQSRDRLSILLDDLRGAS